MPELEKQIRESIARLSNAGADQIDMSARLDTTLGFTSMKMVLLITSLCTTTGIPLTAFTERDLEAMTTPAAIHEHLSRARDPQEI
jgi:acyl carrier protein